MIIKISELPFGKIVWKGDTILGIKGMTLPEEYYEFYCRKVLGDNSLDYELVLEDI